MKGRSRKRAQDAATTIVTIADALSDIVGSRVADEREACAVIAEDWGRADIAAIIRSRSSKPATRTKLTCN